MINLGYISRVSFGCNIHQHRQQQQQLRQSILLVIHTVMLSRLPRTALRQGIRTYAAAADATPPIQLFGVDGTYASALYSASIKSGNLDSVSSALQKIQSTLKTDSKVSTLISNPTLNNADKSVIVEVLAKAVGGDKSITNLLKVMAENNRLGMLPAVSEAFASLISAQKGETDVVITSAQVSIQWDNANDSRSTRKY